MYHIWHNPRCRKSREALAILEEAGKEVVIRLYLEDTPSQKEIKAAIDAGATLDTLIRTEEALYKSDYKAAHKADEISDKEWIQILSENPILIQRPVVIHESNAIVARPPELANEV